MVSRLDLIVRARAGDRRALRVLIEAWQQPVARFVRAQIGASDELPDVCQAVFVKMVRSLPSLREPEAFEGWLFRIARNGCRDHLRRRKGWKRIFVPLDREHEERAEPPPSLHEERALALAAAVAELPGPQRELVLAQVEGGRTYEQLAELQGSSVPAVKSRLFRARERLRSLLARGEDDGD